MSIVKRFSTILFVIGKIRPVKNTLFGINTGCC